MGSKMPNPSAVLPFLGGSRKGKTALGLATLGSKKEAKWGPKCPILVRFCLFGEAPEKAKPH